MVVEVSVGDVTGLDLSVAIAEFIVASVLSD
jgi:hypothetical protein